MLYVVDNARKSAFKSTGVSTSDELFDVSIGLMYGDILSREYDYSDCRITDYILKTEHGTHPKTLQYIMIHAR